MMWPPPPLKVLPPQVTPKKPAEIAKEAAKEIDPFKATLHTALVTTGGETAKTCMILKYFYQIYSVSSLIM